MFLAVGKARGISIPTMVNGAGEGGVVNWGDRQTDDRGKSRGHICTSVTEIVESPVAAGSSSLSSIATQYCTATAAAMF